MPRKCFFYLPTSCPCPYIPFLTGHFSQPFAPQALPLQLSHRAQQAIGRRSSPILKSRTPQGARPLKKRMGKGARAHRAATTPSRASASWPTRPSSDERTPACETTSSGPEVKYACALVKCRSQVSFQIHRPCRSFLLIATHPSIPVPSCFFLFQSAARYGAGAGGNAAAECNVDAAGARIRHSPPSAAPLPAGGDRETDGRQDGARETQETGSFAPSPVGSYLKIIILLLAFRRPASKTAVVISCAQTHLSEPDLAENGARASAADGAVEGADPQTAHERGAVGGRDPRHEDPRKGTVLLRVVPGFFLSFHYSPILSTQKILKDLIYLVLLALIEQAISQVRSAGFRGLLIRVLVDNVYIGSQFLQLFDRKRRPTWQSASSPSASPS